MRGFQGYLSGRYGWVLRQVRDQFMRVYLPGFRGAPVFFVLRTFAREFADNDFALRASAMAYSFFLSVFPALIFLYSLIPYVPIPELREIVERMLAEGLPPQAYELIQPAVRRTFEHRSATFLSLAAAALVFTASRGVLAMTTAFNMTDAQFFRRRGVLEDNLVAIGIFFALFVFLLVAVGALVAGGLAMDYLAARVLVVGSSQFFLLSALNWLVYFFLLLCIVAFLYQRGPAMAQRWRFFNPGTVVASILLFLAHLGLRLYFANFASYDRVYGGLTAIIVLMVWFYWISFVLLLGFELNVAIERTVYEHTIDPSIYRRRVSEAQARGWRAPWRRRWRRLLPDARRK